MRDSRFVVALVTDFGSEGCGFESCRARQLTRLALAEGGGTSSVALDTVSTFADRCFWLAKRFLLDTTRAGTRHITTSTGRLAQSTFAHHVCKFRKTLHRLIAS